MLRLLFFFFNDTATTEIYTLSLHDALPISSWTRILTTSSSPCSTSCTTSAQRSTATCVERWADVVQLVEQGDRKSTRLNSSHLVISYAVFCLKKKTITHSLYYKRRL